MTRSIRRHGFAPIPDIDTPDAVSTEATREMKILCTYCRDDRHAFKWNGGWWHEVARGEVSQSEPCSAWKLRNADDHQ
jgi:hypothetical protein